MSMKNESLDKLPSRMVWWYESTGTGSTTRMTEVVQKDAVATIIEAKDVISRAALDAIGRIKDVAGAHGWNGVENSKLLWEFLNNELDELAALRAERPSPHEHTFVMSPWEHHQPGTRVCSICGIAEPEPKP